MKPTRVVCLSYRTGLGGETKAEDRIAANLEVLRNGLRGVARYRADFICLPEISVHQELTHEERRDAAQAIPGPTAGVVAGLARELNAHIVYGATEREGERLYNSCVIFGRQGEIVGRYRKCRLPDYEVRMGTTPGSEVGVWETEHGKVGMAVCFDLKFPEIGMALARQGAQLVFWPTMFRGGQRLTSWAMDYGFHVVACHSMFGAVVSPAGLMLAGESFRVDVGNDFPGAVVKGCYCEINCDRRTFHLDHHGEKLTQLEKKYGPRVVIHMMASEGIFNLESRMADRTVDDLQVEFGLEPLRDYLDRSRKVGWEAGGGADGLAV
jgi:predicted amidohydrolase